MGKAPVKLYEEEHYRVVKATSKEWAVNAIIKVYESPEKIDLDKLRPGSSLTQCTEVRSFRSNKSNVRGLGGQPSNPVVKNLSDFQLNLIDFPPIEFACIGVGPWLNGVDRHTYFDEQIAAFANLKPVKTVGDDVIMAWPYDKTYILLSTYTMNRATQTPVSMHVFNNPEYSGDVKSFPHTNHLDFEYKVINDIPLPVKKTVNGFIDEEIDGEQTHSEFSHKIDIKWLKVNEELEFPDVDSISRNYSNLYEYIFEEKP
jgi:hypothetical protein